LKEFVEDDDEDDVEDDDSDDEIEFNFFFCRVEK